MLSKKICDESLSLSQGGDFKINVCKDTFFVCKNGFLRFEGTIKTEKQDFCLNVKLGKTPLPDGRILELSIISRDEFKKIKENSKNLLKNCLDYDIIDGSFMFRTRKSGDQISLFPRNVTKTLKKLLNEAKIPQDKRDIIPVLARENEVYWAEGVGVSSLCAVGDNTENILLIKILEK